MISVSLHPHEFDHMQRYIEDTCGIRIDREKAYIIESRLSKLLVELNCASFEELYRILLKNDDKGVVERVIDLITTNETLWFRDQTPWYCLEDLFLPRMVDALRQGTRSKIRIWSAGCSSGQEPYSIVMAIDRYLSTQGIRDITLDHFEIVATDISRTVLKIAQSGRYDSISIMRGLPPEYKDRYFTPDGRVWCISESIRDRVLFKPFNFQDSFFMLGRFDVVFCRYVTIYFSRDLKQDVLKRFASVLLPGGALFLGNSEVYSDYQDSFTLQNHRGGVYYQVKERMG